MQHLNALVVDDHRTFAEALGARLAAYREFDSVDVAFSAEQAIERVDAQHLDVVLLDARLGDTSGIEVLRVIRASRPALAVLVVSGLEDLNEVVAALSEGARAWVPKDASIAELMEALEDAIAGRVWLPRALIGPVLQKLLSRPQVPRQAPSFVDSLTRRQLEVLECLAQGMSRAEIAEHLVLSPHTVRTHVQQVLRKAGVHSTLAAMALARDAGYFRGGR